MARTELRNYWITFLYLAVFFTAFTAYERLILDEYAFGYLAHGTSLLGALILAKIILIGDAMHLGHKMEHRPLAATRSCGVSVNRQNYAPRCLIQLLPEKAPSAWPDYGPMYLVQLLPEKAHILPKNLQFGTFRREPRRRHWLAKAPRASNMMSVTILIGLT